MGLFSRLFRRDNDENEIDLSEYAGMRLEIMSEEREPLFNARANIAWDGELELQPIDVPRLPPYADNIPVLLRGYNEEEKLAVHLTGTLVSRGKGVWLVEDVQVSGKDNERAFFRLETSAAGEVAPMKQWGLGASTCRLINISAGGVCLWTDAAFLPGERFVLQSEILDEWSIKPLICIVRRATKRRYGYEYGCEFSSLPPATEDRITREILEAQRRDKQENLSGSSEQTW